MPAATDQQIPKALTYTLMYHFLWGVMFLLSGIAVEGVILAVRGPDMDALLPPLALIVFAFVALIGAFVAYLIRVQVLLGRMDWATAFRYSAISSWAVIIVAPVLLCAWWLGSALIWHGESEWPLTAQLTVAVLQVEIVVWWLSHLMSIRGISRGRRTYRSASSGDEAGRSVAVPAQTAEVST